MTTASAQQQPPPQPEAHLDDDLEQRRAHTDEADAGSVDREPHAGVGWDVNDDLNDADTDGDNDVGRAFAVGAAWQARQSALALPGLMAALIDAPFAHTAQAAVMLSAEDSVHSLRESFDARRPIPTDGLTRLATLLRAGRVIQELAGREIDELCCRVPPEQLCGEGGLGERIVALRSVTHQDAVDTAFDLLMEAPPTGLRARLSLVEDDQVGLMRARAMLRGDAQREDYALGMLIQAAAPGSSAAALQLLAALLAVAGAPAGEVRAALDRCDDTAVEAVPPLLAELPAIWAVWNGQLPGDDPVVKVLVSSVLNHLFSLIRPLGMVSPEADGSAAAAPPDAAAAA